MLRTLQAGRALAAVSVAAFHLSIGMGLDRYGGEEVFREYTRQGNLGVDFFFVLSGFIILYAHETDIGRPDRWGRYLSRRFIRLFPVYWLYTAVFVGLLLLGFGTDAKMPTDPVDWITSLTLIRLSEVSPPLEVAWTLFHEVAFYATFSLLLLHRRLGLFALCAFGAAGIAPYLFPLPVGYEVLGAYYSGMNLHFFFGMGAFLLFKRGGNGIVETLTGTAMAVGAIAMLDAYEASRIPLGIGFGLMLAGFAKLEHAGRLRVPASLGLVGDASYTIYLAHVSLEGLLLKIVHRTGLHAELGNEATYGVVLVMTVALGVVGYLAVERPLLGFLRGRSARRAKASGLPASS